MQNRDKHSWPLDADYTWREVMFLLTGKSKEGGSLSLEITKHETVVQSESLIKGEHGPLIWIHFGVSDTESWRSQGDSQKNCEVPFGAAYGHRRWSREGKKLAMLRSISEFRWSQLGDPSGYWWPPTYSTWTPTIASFSFSVFAQFTIFSSFFGSWTSGAILRP